MDTKRTYVAVSAGAYPWVPVDSRAETFSVSYAAFHNGTGQVSANIQGTLDNPYTESSCAAFHLVTANASTGLPNDGEITQTIMAIRYMVGVVSGSANVTFQVTQRP